MTSFNQTNARSAVLAGALEFVKQVPPYPPGRPIESVAREFGVDPTQIIKLASNENPRGCSARVSAAIARHGAGSNLYPDFYCYELQHSIAQHLDLPTEMILPAAGSSELISLIARVYLAPGRNAVFPRYSFHSYAAAAQSVGADHIEGSLSGWTPDLEKLLAAITKQTQLVYLASPNNPTGVAVPIADIERLAEVLPEHVVLVLDEAYRDYLEPQDRLNVGRLLSNRQNLLIMRTFSKIYGLAGLRVGYGIGDPILLQLMRKLQLPFSVSSLAQTGATAALEDAAFAAESSRLNASERARVANALEARGIEYVKSAGNFLLVGVGQGDVFTRELMRRGVIVRPLPSYKLNDWVRVTIGLPEQNDRFLDLLDELRRVPVTGAAR